MVVWFPRPYVDFLEDSAEGVAEIVEPVAAASDAPIDLKKKKVFIYDKCFTFSKWLNLI